MGNFLDGPDSKSYLVKKINEAKEEHYAFLLSLDLSDLTIEQKIKDANLRQKLSELEDELLSKIVSKFVD